MDRYDASHDHYCYKGTSTLKNKLNIQELGQLEVAEREITTLTAKRIHFRQPPYNLDYLRSLHRQLFSDLYDWAGELRSVDISKGGTRFCTCTRVVVESQKLFNALQAKNWLRGMEKGEFCEALAEYYCEFNMVHPFREGNGRVQRLFFEHLALSAGYDFDWADVNQVEWIQANIDGVNVNYGTMANIFKRIITRVA
ncbi:putative adenosine monophosphate-protein transferase Fic [Dyella ginsengisoli]|uniref:putative adenosine monophosphate-protein transferase Fic n=1 Tax=Dyella ginsengisoli TaxID=363848 RepID=UPI000366F73B|nr:putative adenosine monophosphate-protein transferase Fic [Dyella ginsengisoli]